MRSVARRRTSTASPPSSSRCTARPRTIADELPNQNCPRRLLPVFVLPEDEEPSDEEASEEKEPAGWSRDASVPDPSFLVDSFSLEVGDVSSDEEEPLGLLFFDLRRDLLDFRVVRDLRSRRDYDDFPED